MTPGEPFSKNSVFSDSECRCVKWTPIKFSLENVVVYAGPQSVYMWPVSLNVLVRVRVGKERDVLEVNKMYSCTNKWC